jgi:hypothetical protein
LGTTPNLGSLSNDMAAIEQKDWLQSRMQVGSRGNQRLLEQC